MRAKTCGRWLLFGGLFFSACLLPSKKRHTPQADTSFLGDEELLRPSEVVTQGYLSPKLNLRDYHSIRIPDFENATGHEIIPQAERVAAEALAEELERFPERRRAFQLIDRSPATATAEVDLLLEGAITVFNTRMDDMGRARLNDKIKIAIECRILDAKTREVVALIRNRQKQNRSYVGYENPVRIALRGLARGIAEFITQPDIEAGSGKKGKKKKK